MKVIIINGPNLNLIGTREPEIYGSKTFENFLAEIISDFKEIDIKYLQSNVEGDIINFIQQYGFDGDTLGIVLNAGGYSHTSIAIADAIAAIKTPVIGVHISNIFNREKERHTDLLAASCLGMISGLGLKGYSLAVSYFLQNEGSKK
jgi:3-dehydroquinate dehydratase II